MKYFTYQTCNAYLELCKMRIAAFSALSVATGFVLVKMDLTVGLLAPTLGVFILACGAGAMNQYQERITDALMSRTKTRSIPSGRIKEKHALYIAIVLILAGISVLSLTRKPIVPGLGIFAVIWYNLVYTYLKKKTAFATIPGALTGAIAPVIGWVSGGGNLTDYELPALCFFFFMWQVPHFWLILLTHEGDFKNARLPSLNTIFSHDQLIKITFIWMIAAAVSCLLLPLYGVSNSNIVSIILVVITAWLIWNGIRILRQKENKNLYSTAFKNINIYIMLVMLALNIGSLFSL